MREHNQQSYSPEHYRTGPTAPPKSHGGIIAILLIAVIFLCGVVNMMGVMNIRLFRMLQTQQQQTVSLQVRSGLTDPQSYTPQSAEDHGDRQACLGITCHEVTPFYQEYYQIPQGIYISHVDPQSDCFARGLRDGDILLTFNGFGTSEINTLISLLEQCQPGDTAQLRFYRKGSEHTISVTIGEK